MNIHDVTVSEVPNSSSLGFWKSFMIRRNHTFSGFCEIERFNGGVIYPGIVLSSVKGQEALRMLFFRTLEEYSESLESTESEHILEELIDSMNYLLSIPFLDYQLMSENQVAYWMDRLCHDLGTFTGERPTFENLGRMTYIFGMRVGDILRNRAWTQNAQDIVFSGATILEEALLDAARLIMRPFHDFPEFAWFLLAKDEVLKFRLRSRY